MTLIVAVLPKLVGDTSIQGAGDDWRDNQRYRAGGLNLVVAAIVLWNIVYLERAVQALRDSGRIVDDTKLRHLSPRGWEHINLTGDDIWHQSW